MLRSEIDKAMTEKEFSQQVIELAKACGWEVYHTWNSLHSAKGFPDLCMVRDDRLCFIELKSMKGKITPDQQVWLDKLFNTSKCEVHVLKPSDWDFVVALLQRG